MVVEKDHQHCNYQDSNSESIDKGNRIIVQNYINGDILNYSLALIRGQASNSCRYISIRDCENTGAEWPIINGEFRVIVELKRGMNSLKLNAGESSAKLILIYEPRETRLRVTPVYVICAGHDGYFQGPRGEDCSPESAATRIGLGVRLLQCLTAEKLREAGHGRKTFQLERDLDGPECLIMHSILNVDQARQMSQQKLWKTIGRELMTGPFASKDRKYLAFLSCTKYKGAPYPRTHEDILARTQGHAALGGGGLALFGSACLHTWPTCISQVLPRFLDTTSIDIEHLMDDSNHRGTHGGCLATTLGSVLHELGHTFDLGHTKEGIMGRGFDNIDRVFIGSADIDFNHDSKRKYSQHTIVHLSRQLSVTITIQDQSNSILRHESGGLYSRNLTRPDIIQWSSQGSSSDPIDKILSVSTSTKSDRPLSKAHFQSTFNLSICQRDRTFWSASCATILAYHRWFNNCNRGISHQECKQINYDAKRNLVQSRHGMRVIELREYPNGMVVFSRQFPGLCPPTEVLIPPYPHKTSAILLVAEDSPGNVLKYLL